MNDVTQCVPKTVLRLLERLTKKICELPWVDKVILYGSYAKGDFCEDSDLDLAVFSKDEIPSYLEQYRQVARLCQTDEMDIQAQVFDARELNDPCGIVEEIVAYGVDITGLKLLS